MRILNKKNLILALTLCAAAVFISTLLQSTIYVTNDETDAGVGPVAPALSVTGSDIAGEPARIRISKIGVDAIVQHVGRAKSGNMAVPTNFTDAGWYREGTVPGNIGSAVIDGHVDNALGLPGVFIRLGELEEGDDIYIDTEEGNTLHFVVESAAEYAVEDVPREILFNRSDAPRLNLITCQGNWISDKKMYDRRLVVYARLVG